MVSLVKKLSILLLFALPCRAQLLDLTKHAQGGGSQDTFLQGGTTTPTWGTLTSGCVAITYTSHAFACVPASDASHNGYLSSTDWMTFNGKQPAGSYALQSTTLTASSPLTGGGDLSTNRSFGCQASSASQAGCLSSTDWSTFNSKQPAGSYALQSLTLTATAPITGGGDLSSNRSFGCATANTTTTGCLSSTDWNIFNGKGSGSVTSIATTSPITGGTITGTGTIACATCAVGPGSSTAGHLAGFASTDGLTLADITVIPSATVATTQSQNDNSTKISTTAYTDLAVSNAIAGVNPAVAVLVATTAAGDTSALTYNNGVSGIGATFTGAVNTALTIDGVTFSAVGQRLLVKNDTQSPSGAFNGVYYVTQIQTAILPPILTRALDYDQPSDMNNTGAIPVQSGTVNGTTSWVLTSQVVTVGTTPLTFTKFSLAPSTIVTASSPGVGIAHFAGGTQAVTSSAVNLAGADVTGVTPIANGGTNATTAATAFANLAQTPTSPLTLSGAIYGCPTCSTGPDTTIIGGMLGAQVQAIGNAITLCWFCTNNASQTFSTLSTDVWVSGLTANINGTMSVGSFYSVGLVNYGITTGYPYGAQFVIPGGSVEGSYQSSTGPVFVNGIAKSSVNVTSISPSGGAASTLNFVTANVIGQNIQPQRWGSQGGTVAGSATVYVNPSQSVTPNATESLMVIAFPYAGTVSSICFTSTGAQPAGGGLAATLRYGATFGAIADSTLTTTIPASAGAGVYCDLTHTVSVAAGGVSTIKLVNGSGSTSATMNGVSYNITPSGAGPTGMIVFASGAQTIGSGAAVFFSPFKLNSVSTATEANATAGMSRAGTAKNLYCYVTTAPGTSSDVVTVRQNKASPASGLAVTITTSTTGIISDTSHTISLANKDLIDLQHNQTSGSNPAVSSCSMEID